MTAGGKTRIAVLGGGMSSLVTAFELTSLPGWDERYQITVYQQGWRLGGKGASGRDASRCNRNEEHGLHLLFGCYENVFRLLRRCYAELEREPGELAWQVDDAVAPHDAIVMYENVDGGWLPWTLDVPRGEGTPGVGPPLPLSPLTYVLLLVRWARQQMVRWPGVALGHGGVASWWEELVDDVDALLAGIRDVLHRAPRHEDLRPPLDHLHQAEKLLEALDRSGAVVTAAGEVHEAFDTVVHLLERFHAWARVQPALETGLRRLRVMIDFAVAVSKGLVADRVLFPRENWFAIDRFDLREWLSRHGASEETCRSAIVSGLYDAVFSPPTLGAGTILHALYRASHYKGAILYRMQAGMGDVIFAPLYRVLQRRGVRFRFFHRVEQLVLSADRGRIERVLMRRQADVLGDDYQPLVLVEGVYAWPSAPLAAQLAPGVPRETDFEDWWDAWAGAPCELIAGEDFDALVLGISIGAFGDICRELIDNPAKPAFGDMARAVRTTQTQGVQLWLHPPLAELGWQGGERPVIIPYADPLNTWADMSHLIARESFPAGEVGTQLYLCAALPDTGAPPPVRPAPGHSARERDRVFDVARAWLAAHAAQLWPGAGGGPAGLDWTKLVDPGGGAGEARLRAQHIVATSNPSDRYVWSVTGSSAHRLRADRSGYANLYLTGDWTLNAVSIGCLEGATMGGMQTARAIDRRVPRALYDWLPEEEPAGASPRYVVRDGELLAPPPVDLELSLQTFVVEASYEALNALCEEQLNLGGATTYRPVGPFVVVYAADMLNVVPQGTIPELDFGVWVPVVAVEGHIPRRLLTFTPYIWVDSSPALVGGRTVFGFPKHVGILRGQPGDPGGPGFFTVDTWVVLEEGGRAVQRRVLQIEHAGGAPDERAPARWRSAADAVLHHGTFLGSLLECAEAACLRTWDSVTDLFHASVGMPMVFLKQYRAADGSDRACYQAVIEASVRVTGELRGGPILRAFEVGVLECYSHRIASTLGLRTSRRNGEGSVYGVAPALAAGWMQFSARVEPGRVVWEAGTEGS